MHFRGRYVWMNGDVYEGEWKRGLRDGCREVVKRIFNLNKRKLA